MVDDTIYRQAAIDAVRHSPIIEVQPAYMLIDKADVLKNLLMLPPAQRKGKWIYLNGLDAFECSVCGRQMVRNIFDYCPWCGARMERRLSDGI